MQEKRPILSGTPLRCSGQKAKGVVNPPTLMRRNMVLCCRDSGVDQSRSMKKEGAGRASCPKGRRTALAAIETDGIIRRNPDAVDLFFGTALTARSSERAKERTNEHTAYTPPRFVAYRRKLELAPTTQSHSPILTPRRIRQHACGDPAAGEKGTHDSLDHDR